MPKLALYNQEGVPVGELEVPEAIFAAPVKEAAVYSAAMAQEARRRQGNAATKNRGEVRGGGSKPWVQKGTGRARHGSIRSPIWVGGGTVFGPRPRDYGFAVPKKVRRAAVKSVLSSKAQENKLLVIEGFNLERPRTKEMIQILNKLQVAGKALIVTAEPEPNVIKSARNLPGVKTILADQLNVLDLLNHDYLLMTRAALERVQEVFGK
ncbi:MAG: 50S ribosomal protein L4 [Dethiobacteria bacterium]|nr:50S ribosomal protein L4 [Bacillota bacterium]HOP68288.1 50S ribosomal protein L4 [Bacillota bacterium]HPT33955.1 50S ribosomal protein L4 [Bacillota bacterium]HQD05917.1 50S ribosomal protein L4 [Bacillota bacterium]